MRTELAKISTNFNGTQCYVHARGVFKENGFGIITMQKLELSGCDHFHGIEFITTNDFGKNFSEPKSSEGLKRRYFPEGKSEVMCDATPFYHKKTGKIILIGHLATYIGDKGDPKQKSTTYAIFDEETGDFTPVSTIEIPDENSEKYYIVGSGCSQIYETESGELLIPIYFRSLDSDLHFYVAIMRCSFDAEKITLLEIGNDITTKEPRGFCEPSIIKFNNEYYIALRNDVSGYIAKSYDGIHIEEPIKLCFDDGEDLGNYNTQQHWIAGGNKLWLVYTRRTENNEHVFRHRAPLFMAELEPNTMRILRSTERIVVPERGARLGNFGCQSYNDEIGYVFASEWMQGDNGLEGCQKYGSDNSIFITKLLFEQENNER